MSHRARRSRAEAPDEAVELAAGEVRRAFEEWASRFVALLVRDLAPSVAASYRRDSAGAESDATVTAPSPEANPGYQIPRTAETSARGGDCMRFDATIEGIYREVGRAQPRAEKLEQAFRMLDKQSADELRVAGVPTADVIRNADVRKQEWLRANTDLIKAEADLRRRVERIIQDPLNQGRSVSDIAKLLEEQAGYSTSRAVLTARDQTLKLYGQVQQERQQNAGVERYIWTTSLDERVRPDHADLDGTVQRWDDPPIVDQRTGRRGHPGFDFSCRCTAVPVLDEPAEGEPPTEQARQVSLRERAVAEGRFAAPPPREPAMRPTQTEIDAERARRAADAERLRLEREADARIAAARAEAQRIEAERQAAQQREIERQAAEARALEAAREAERQRLAAEAAEAERLAAEERAFVERLEAERIAQEAAAEAARVAALAAKPVEVKEVPKFEGTEPKAKTAKMWRATSQSKYNSMSLIEKTAINAFVHSEYRHLRALQEGRTVEEVAAERFAPSIARIRELKAMLPELKLAQRKLSVPNPTQFGTLYRGLALESEQFQEALNANEFTFKATSNSTSYSYETALGFASGQYQRQAVVLRIKSVREGAFVGFKENTNRGETEVVVSNRKFKVTGKTRSKLDDVLVIDLEETAESALRADAAEPLTHKLPLRPASEREGRFWSDGWDVEFS